MTNIVENFLQIQNGINISLAPAFARCNCLVTIKTFKKSVKISRRKMNDSD